MTIDEKALEKARAAFRHWHELRGYHWNYCGDAVATAIEAYLSALPPSPATVKGWRPSVGALTGELRRDLSEALSRGSFNGVSLSGEMLRFFAESAAIRLVDMGYAKPTKEG